MKKKVREKEEAEASGWWVCAACFEKLQDHGPAGKCLFASTHFTPRKNHDHANGRRRIAYFIKLALTPAPPPPPKSTRQTAEAQSAQSWEQWAVARYAKKEVT